MDIPFSYNILVFLTIVFVTPSLFFLYKNAFGDLSLSNANVYTYVFYISLILQVYVSAIIMYSWVRNHHALADIRDVEEYFLFTFLWCCYALICIPLTMIVLSKVHGVNIVRSRKMYFVRPFFLGRPSQEKMILCLVTMCAFIFVPLIYYFSYANSSLEYYLNGGTDCLTLMQLRSERIFSSVGVRIVRNIFLQGFGSILGYSSFYYYRITKRRSWKLISLVFFCFMVVIGVSSLSKASLVMVFVPYFFILIATGYRPRFSHYVIYAILGLFCLYVFYTILGRPFFLPGSLRDQFASDTILGRVMIGQLAGMPNYFSIFPDQHDFLYGSGSNIGHLFGSMSDSASRIAMIIHNPKGIASGKSGVQNTFFMGAAYANFGIYGLVFAPLWVGFVMYVVLICSFRFPKHPMVSGFFIYIMFTLSRGLSGGFISEWFSNTRLISVTVLLFFFVLCAQLFSRILVCVSNSVVHRCSSKPPP